MASITSANAILALGINQYFPTPQIIQGFAVDDAFESESVQQSEVLMGVDGILSGGKVFVPYKMTIHLQADSPSVFLFDAWRNAQNAALDVFSAFGSISLSPSPISRPPLPRSWPSPWAIVPNSQSSPLSWVASSAACSPWTAQLPPSPRPASS